jgi:hypothetical protein
MAKTTFTGTEDSPTERTWNWTLNSLWIEGAETRCNLRIIDTVLFDTASNQPERWLFTSKSGTVAKKKEANITYTKIKERFCRFALANPNNTEKSVCMQLTADGQQNILDQQDFAALISKAEAGGLRNTAALQCYLRPKGGEGFTYRNEYILEAGRATTQTKRIKIGGSRAQGLTESALTVSLDTHTSNIINYIQQYRQTKVMKAVVDYVVDDNNEVWLSHVPWLFTTGPARKEKVSKRTKKKPSKGASALVAQENDGHETLRTSQSLPAVRVKTPDTSLPASNSNSSSCKGEYCYIPLNSFPGLLGVTKSKEDDGDVPSWRKDLKKLRSKQWGENSETDHTQKGDSFDEVIPDSGQRFQVAQKEVMLANKEEAFLKNEVHDADPSSLARRWMEVDETLHSDLGSSNPAAFYGKCNVCSNCFQLYSRMSKLRKHKFRHSGEGGGKEEPFSKENLGTGGKKASEVDFFEDESSTSGRKSKPKSSKAKKEAAMKAERKVQWGDDVGEDSVLDLMDGSGSADFVGQEGGGEDFEGEIEARIAEAEAKAAKMENGQGSSSGIGGSTHREASMTDTEKAFMNKYQKHQEGKGKAESKKAAKGSPAKSKQRAQPVEDPLAQVQAQAQAYAAAGAVSGGDFAETSRLRQNNFALDQEVQMLREKLIEEQSTGAVRQTELKTISKKLVEARRQFTQAMREKEEAMRRELLEAEKKFHQEMSLKTSLASQKYVAGTSAEDKQTAEMMRSVEMLNQQLAGARSEFEEERARLVRKHKEEMERTEERRGREAGNKQQVIVELEEKIEEMQSGVGSAQKESAVARKMQQAAQRQLQEVEIAKQRLEQEHRVLEQSLASMSSMGGGGGGMGGEAAAGALALQKSTSDARERQLKNKVEYLKAQLGSETKCKEDLEGSIRQLTAKIGMASGEKREALEKADKVKKEEIEKIELRMAAEMEMPRAELAQMQEKVLQMQTQISDLVQDAALAKKKEDKAKLEASRAQEEAGFLAKEVAKLNRSVEDANSKLATSVYGGGEGGAGAEEAQKASMEAMLRRVENERQYLKSQLDTEVECKNALETALAETNARFSEAQTVWTKKEGEMSETLRENDKSGTAQLSELQHRKIGLESEVASLEEQLKEQRKSGTRLRDQLRTEQRAIESARADVSKLQGELMSAREDLLSERKLRESSEARQRESMAKLESSIRSLEGAKGAQIVKLEGELKSRTAKIGTVQSQLLDLEDEMAARSVVHTKAMAAHRLGTAVTGLLHRRLICRFAQWARGAHAEAAEEWAREELAAQADSAKGEATVAQAEAVAKAKREGEAERRAALDAVARKEAQLQWDRDCMARADQESARAEWKAAERGRAERAAKKAVERVEKGRKEEAEKWREQMHRAMEQAAQQQRAAVEAAQEEVRVEVEEAMGEELDGKEEATKTAIAAVAAQAEEEVKRVQRSHAQEIEDVQRQCDEEKRMAAKVALQEAQEKVLEAERKANAEGLAARMEEEEKRKEAVKKVQSEAEAALIEMKQECDTKVREAEEARLQEVAAAKKASADTKAKMESDSAKAAEEHVKSALEEQMEKMNRVKANAIMHTTSKWQKMLADCEAKIELEKAQARVAGMKETEERWQTASGDSKKAQDAQIAAAKAKYEQLEAAVKEEAARASASNSEAAALQLAKAQEATEGVRAAAKHELSITKKEAEEKMAMAMVAAREEANQRMKEALEKAKRDQAEAVALAREEVEEEAEKAHAEMEAEMEKAVQGAAMSARQSTAADMQRQTTQMLQAEVRRVASEHKAELEIVRQEAEATKRQELDQVRWEEEAKWKAQADKMRGEAAAQQEQALEELQMESEKLIGDVEQAMRRLKSEKDDLSRQLGQGKADLEKNEDTVYDLQTEVARVKEEVEEANKELEKAKQREHAQDRELEKQEEAAQRVDAERERDAVKHQAELDKARTEALDHAAQVNELQAKQEQMHDTLVNHKREVLMEHKIQSEVIQNDITLLLEHTDEIDSVKAQLLHEQEQMEGAVAELEEQLQQMSKQTSLKDGRINVAHRTKKKRLDTELEQMLEAIDEKRSRISGVEAKLAELNEQRQDKEDEMKGLERNLVEVMVEQQKKLLKTLTSVGAVGTTLNAASKFKGLKKHA